MAKPYKLRIDTDSIKCNIRDDFRDGGNTIDIEIKLPYPSLQTVRNIRNCHECPVGYMDNNCGRRIPLDYNCVPETCKLKKVLVSDLLRLVATYVDIDNMTK